MEAYELMDWLRDCAEKAVSDRDRELFREAADMIEQMAQRIEAAEAEPEIVRWAREASKGCRHE